MALSSSAPLPPHTHAPPHPRTNAQTPAAMPLPTPPQVGAPRTRAVTLRPRIECQGAGLEPKKANGGVARLGEAPEGQAPYRAHRGCRRVWGGFGAGTDAQGILDPPRILKLKPKKITKRKSHT